ncbi:MAG: dicarboxylate/amino acid:cation symporter [Bacteroidales bacterium]|jgi:Na+/H+-dicarboxylate symporter|nr:dicarboxylate/amino acid:cation symporter [Bacteroidales bacterium]
MKLHWQIFLALVLGTITGVAFPGVNPYTSWIGELFMNALSMLIVPLVFFSIISGIIGIAGSGGGVTRLGARIGGFYILTMMAAILTGLILVNLIRPGSHIHVENAAIPAGIGQTSVKDIVVGFVPKNILEALSSNQTIPVIVIAFLVGLNLHKISPEKKNLLTGFFQGGLELILHITRAIIKCSPVGIFAIVVKQFASTPDYWGLLQTMLLYMLTVLAGLVIHVFVWLHLMIRFYKVNPIKHFRNMSVPLLTAFSTASSGATLPLTLHAVEHRDGVSSRITNFTIPLGATVNMDGTGLLECVAVIFIAQAYGIELGIVQQAVIVAVSLLCAIGSAGIPMAALVMMALILTAVGLPLEGIGLVIGVDRILDMARTAVNVYGDTCVAVMVAKAEGETLSVDRK